VAEAAVVAAEAVAPAAVTRPSSPHKCHDWLTISKNCESSAFFCA